MKSNYDILFPFLSWTDSEDLTPAGRAIEFEAGLRRKTPERRLVWRRMRLLLGCLTDTSSAYLLVDELPVDKTDLMRRGEGGGLSVRSVLCYFLS